MRTLNIYHLYPDHLNLYGDRGNMIALYRRAEWRNINLEVTAVKPGDKIDFSSCHMLFMGGGQDSDQKLIAADLFSYRKEILKAVENGMVVFAVCGSYQLLGHYYITASEERISGLEILDLYTESKKKRLTGNAAIECPLLDPPQTLVGFENHGGRTYLHNNLQPLGKVLYGYGNNGVDKTEGAVYKNVIGTYLHGSLLPKNPWLTDLLLQKSLSYAGLNCHLQELDDSIEQQAHKTALKLAASDR